MPEGFYQRSVRLLELEENTRRRLAMTSAKEELGGADGVTFVDVAVPTETDQLGKTEEKEGGAGLKECHSRTATYNDPCPACDSTPARAPDDSEQFGKDHAKNTADTLKPPAHSGHYSDE